jgi:hypothetical protein
MTVQAEIVSARSTEWAEKILASMAKGLEAVLQTGKTLIAAKADCEHGEWLDALRLAGLLPNSALRFMAVAAHPVLANSDHDHYLPGSWTTLYALSRIKPPLLEAAIADGRVRPEMTRADAERLDPNWRPAAHPRGKHIDKAGRWECPLCHGKGWVDKEPRDGFGRYSRKSELAS